MTVESNRTGVLRAGTAVNPSLVLAEKPRNHEHNDHDCPDPDKAITTQEYMLAAHRTPAHWNG
jgi:hypothetical protein